MNKRLLAYDDDPSIQNAIAYLESLRASDPEAKVLRMKIEHRTFTTSITHGSDVRKKPKPTSSS